MDLYCVEKKIIVGREIKPALREDVELGESGIWLTYSPDDNSVSVPPKTLRDLY